MLKFQEEKCIGCKLCHLACSAAKESEFNPRLARLAVDSRYQGRRLVITAQICDLCGACAEVCPTEAITIKDGRINYHKEECTDCGLCIAACEKMIITKRDSGVALCDYCGGSPWCARWCPHEALTWEVCE